MSEEKEPEGKIIRQGAITQVGDKSHCYDHPDNDVCRDVSDCSPDRSYKGTTCQCQDVSGMGTYDCDTNSFSSCKSHNDGSNSGCFLTTACVESAGLPDDCLELKTLRSFRDNWLSVQPGGKAEVQSYYSFAPKVVDAINEQNPGMWAVLFNELVKPAVELIQKKQYAEARELYVAKTLELKEQFLGE